jgi:hypothetical protein
MRYRDQGHEVRAVQEALLAKGYELPRYGADSDFGQETVVALQRFASDEGIAWNPEAEVPQTLLDALGAAPAVEVIAPCSEVLDLEGVPFYDLRSEQADPHPKSKRDGKGKTVQRMPTTIDSIVLHQTAVKFSGPSDDQLARRALGVACHAMAFHPGFLVWSADLRWYIYHADRLNARSLGLEVDGNYPGCIGGKCSNGKNETPLTDGIVKAARVGIKLLVEEGRRLGCPIKYIFAHRQCDSWRQADPGEGLWRRVVLEYAVPELGLMHRPTETFPHPKGSDRTGRPIPTRWDPNGVGKY